MAKNYITISFGGAAIAYLAPGQMATIDCAGVEEMKSNIVIDFAIAGSVEYNGTVTAFKEGQTATLECAGQKMLSDVVVMASADGSDASTALLDAYCKEINVILEEIVNGGASNE